MPKGSGGSRVAAALIVAAVGLTACGGRFRMPPDAKGVPTAPRQATPTGGGIGAQGADGTQNASGGSTPRRASAPSGGTSSGSASLPPTTTVPAPPSQHRAIADTYHAYLTDLSGLDDTLSKGYLAPLASVTTTRLGQASARQAAAILAAHEHGVGTLRDAHMQIRMTGPESAALADCQDEEHFYLVNDQSGTPDSFVERGYFVGSAQLVLQSGHWLVDTFTTTHVPCSF